MAVWMFDKLYKTVIFIDFNKDDIGIYLPESVILFWLAAHKSFRWNWISLLGLHYK